MGKLNYLFIELKLNQSIYDHYCVIKEEINMLIFLLNLLYSNKVD